MNGGTRRHKVRGTICSHPYIADIAGEYQPVYDEFGSILLLVLAFVHRYGLDYHDLGISHESFVAQLLTRGHRSIPQEQLTEEHGKQLGTWLKGLYDSDKEALGNDVFASSRPQDFYLIVPTLFSQTVLACSAEVLSLDTVKGGLECKWVPQICLLHEILISR
jgi:mediator of RNA polymerase II transcription subunit 5